MNRMDYPSLAECISAGEKARRQGHRPAPMTLPSDPSDATATALSVINGDDFGSVDRAAAVEGLTARIAKLADSDGKAALNELAHHLPVLHALFLRMATEAATATNPDHKAKLLRMSLAAQTNYARTAALLVTLRQDSRPSVILNEVES